MSIINNSSVKFLSTYQKLNLSMIYSKLVFIKKSSEC